MELWRIRSCWMPDTAVQKILEQSMKDVRNLKLVLAIGEILSDRGLDVEYTRTTDVYETPYEKAMKANNAGVDLFVSIHRNSFPVDNEVEGVESLVYDLSGLKYEMAQNISLETYKDAGGAGRSRIHQFGYRQSAV